MDQQSYNLTRFQVDHKRDTVWSVFAPHLQKKFSIKGQVLDLGCGYGSFINNIDCEKKCAIDLNVDMKKYLKPDVEFHAGTTLDLSKYYKPKQFDFIFSSNLLEHLTREDIHLLFTDVKSLLKDNGSFIVFMPNYRLASAEYFDDYTHLTPLSDRSLADWLSAFNLKVQFKHPSYMPYSVKDSRLPIHPFLIKLWLLSPFKPGGKQMLIQAVK